MKFEMTKIYRGVNMKLIGSLTSPYVRKVRLVLAAKMIKIPFELENVWGADTRIQALNPLGKIPVLLLEDEVVLFDSRVIVEYLDTLSPNARLIPASGKERADVRCIEALADGIVDAAVTIRLELTLRPSIQQSPEWIMRQRGKIDAGLRSLSDRLGDKAHYHGSHESLADIAVAVALGYLDFRMPDIHWREHYLNLNRFYQRAMQRPGFTETAPPAQ
jgi:glutathione S-transferase